MYVHVCLGCGWINTAWLVCGCNLLFTIRNALWGRAVSLIYFGRRTFTMSGGCCLSGGGFLDRKRVQTSIALLFDSCLPIMAKISDTSLIQMAMICKSFVARNSGSAFLLIIYITVLADNSSDFKHFCFAGFLCLQPSLKMCVICSALDEIKLSGAVITDHMPYYVRKILLMDTTLPDVWEFFVLCNIVRHFIAHFSLHLFL